MMTAEELNKIAGESWEKINQLHPNGINAYPYVIGYKEAYKQYANQSKWISVEERLPEAKDNKIKSVLVRIKNNTLVAWYFPKHFKSVEFDDWDDFDIDNYPYMEEDKEKEIVWLNEGWYIEYYHQDYLYQEPINVTHWQPLPEKP